MGIDQSVDVHVRTLRYVLLPVPVGPTSSEGTECVTNVFARNV